MNKRLDTTSNGLLFLWPWKMKPKIERQAGTLNMKPSSLVHQNHVICRNFSFNKRMTSCDVKKELSFILFSALNGSETVASYKWKGQGKSFLPSLRITHSKIYHFWSVDKKNWHVISTSFIDKCSSSHLSLHTKQMKIKWSQFITQVLTTKKLFYWQLMNSARDEGAAIYGSQTTIRSI